MFILHIIATFLIVCWLIVNFFNWWFDPLREWTDDVGFCVISVCVVFIIVLGWMK